MSSFVLDKAEERPAEPEPQRVPPIAPPAQSAAGEAGEASGAARAPSAGMVLSPGTFQPKDPPRAHIEPELGLSTLQEAVGAIEENQQRIESAELRLQGLLRMQARLVAASRLLEQQKVLDVLSAPDRLGYDRGRPVAALVIYRCCLRWGSFNSSDLQAASVLDSIAALLVHVTDEDVINARHTARATAAARASSGGGAGDAGSFGGGFGGGFGALVDVASSDDVATAAAAGATREVAYWLAVTSTLLALVDPRLPLGPQRGAPPPASLMPTPLAAVAGDARASMARAASAAAAKVQELQKKMGSTFGNMQLLGRNFLMRRRAAANGGPGAAGPEAEPAEAAKAEEGPAAAPAPAAVQDAQPPRARAPQPAPTQAAPQQHPCQAFRQHLDIVVQKTYNQERDTFKRCVSAVLPDCVQQPQQSPPCSSGGAPPPESAADGEEGHARGSSGGVASPKGGVADGGAGGPDMQPWRQLIGVLSHHLAVLRDAHVPRIITRCILKQTVGFINVQLFNQLLLRPECCCTSNARYLVAGLHLLDEWLAGGEDLALLTEDLKHVRQAAQFLALGNKGALSLDELRGLAPDLNVQQLYRLATTFWDDSPHPLVPSARPSADVAARGASGTGAEGDAADAAEPSGKEEGDAPAEPAEDGDTAGEDGSVTAGDGEELAAAAAAAVAAAEAAAAADEAASVAAAGAGPAAELPPPPPSYDAAMAAAACEAAVSRTVSGEVLEELKRVGAVANNGGLIVTFLLDEDSTPLIAPGGVVAKQLLRVINEPRLAEGLAEGLPAALRSGDCPPVVFAFLQQPEAAAYGAPAAQEQGGGGLVGRVGSGEV